MENDKIQELLLQLLQDMAIVKEKLNSIEEIKIDAKTVSNRVDKLEAHCERHDKQLSQLENRANTLEQFVRNNLSDTKKQQTSVFISMGLAIFGAILSFVFSML
jgi:predicted  nucleic acid-binding Zn-ribbon protein